MRGSTTKRRAWSIAIVLALGCLLAILWPSRAERLLLFAPWSEAKGKDGTQGFRQELTACGPEAIAPTLSTIQRHNIEDRDWLRQLPVVLHDLGEPAHHALLEHIDAMPHSLARTRLMAALQLGFSDYSRFEGWLTNAMAGGSAWYAGQFAEDIADTFADAPRLRDSRAAFGFNPEFLQWWRTNSLAKTLRQPTL